jgi:hypothetical protein
LSFCGADCLLFLLCVVVLASLKTVSNVTFTVLYTRILYYFCRCLFQLT